MSYAEDFTNQSTRRAGLVDEVLRAQNSNKSRIRVRVEHVFAVFKPPWGLPKCATEACKRVPRVFLLCAGLGKRLLVPNDLYETGAALRTGRAKKRTPIEADGSEKGLKTANLIKINANSQRFSLSLIHYQRDLNKVLHL